MDNPQSLPEQHVESNDPFGSSLFSIHRSSVQHFILLVATNALLITMTVTSSLLGSPVMIALSATTMITVMAMTALVVRVGIRTIAVEAWIRRLGVGDLEYRVEPWGNDEVSKACLALETLRLRSLEVVRLQLVEQLSAQLETKNRELEDALVQLREAQDQVVANQKLSEMVDLASGVAHEIRNPLNFVSNFCEGSAELLDELIDTLSQEKRDDDEIREISGELRANMDHIRRNVGRADRILDGMISLGSSHGAWQEVSLNLLVRQSVGAVLDADVAANGRVQPQVEVREAPADPHCLSVPEGMALAIMCLVRNACEAVAAAERPNAPVIVSVEVDGDQGHVAVRDEGCGMTPEVLERAMTPFFTTKAGDNQGAGLGLCQAAEVARAHGGNVALASTAGRGSTVTLTVQLRPSMATTSDQQA